MLYRKFTEALKTVSESNRIIRNADRNKVLSYADTIYKFAPHVASDVNLLSQLLANAIHGEGVDPTTIETITRLEERYSKDTAFKPKNYT
jgi:F0F1-type ATP synthase beta subunit